MNEDETFVNVPAKPSERTLQDCVYVLDSLFAGFEWEDRDFAQEIREAINRVRQPNIGFAGSDVRVWREVDGRLAVTLVLGIVDVGDKLVGTNKPFDLFPPG